MGASRAITSAVVMMCAAHGCLRPTVPDVAGRWSGSMMLELGQGNHAFVTVEVTLNQDGEHLSGRWRTADTTEFAANGDVTGRIARDGSRQQVDMDFSFVRRQPNGAQPCTGTAKASGQLTYNTTVSSSANQDRTPKEEPGWGIRLKAFDGVSFEACSPVRYATWTLTRKRGGT